MNLFPDMFSFVSFRFVQCHTIIISVSSETNTSKPLGVFVSLETSINKITFQMFYTVCIRAIILNMYCPCLGRFDGTTCCVK